jgi:D-arabinan endo alpha-(1,5)-arabinofuranosidase
VTWSGAVGGDAAQQLWYYEHNNPTFSTVLPSDVITIGGTMYLHAMVNQGLGNVVCTEIRRSDDSGATWQHTGAKFPPDLSPSSGGDTPLAACSSC